MKHALPILASLALGACATLSAQSQTRHEGPAALGQATHVDGPVVTPLQVIEDSRCPMNARCVWAGRVVLKARIAGGSWSVERDLTLGTPIAVADGTLALVSVTPDRRTDRAIGPRDYRFTFDFRGWALGSAARCSSPSPRTRSGVCLLFRGKAKERRMPDQVPA